MKKIIGGAAALVAAGITVAAPAGAMPRYGDTQFLECIESGWGAPSSDPIASINWGHRIASDIESGVRDPRHERDYIWRVTDIDTIVRANVMVNCSTKVYLGYGPGSVPPGEVPNPDQNI